MAVQSSPSGYGPWAPRGHGLGVFFAPTLLAMRVSFLVDGFNLYHSVKSAERHTQAGPLRWLDVHGLCSTLLRSTFGPGASLEGVYYFSALAKHLEAWKPDVVRRHRTFISALESKGVQVSLANFKRKDRYEVLSRCRLRVEPFRKWWRIPVPRIRLSFRTHEEKETDVAIACKLLELLHRNQCDTAVLLTGDTDIAPAIRTAQQLFPRATVCVAFPFDRHNRDLERQASKSLKIGAALYQRHQLPPTIQLKSGRLIAKPASW